MTSIAVTATPQDHSGNVYAIIGQTIPADRIDQALQSPDGLKVAYDVGVLELLSLGLTLFAILLGLFAVFGFWMIRGAAIRAAAQAAREHAEQISTGVAERVARKLIEERATDLFSEAMFSRPTSSAVTPDIRISDKLEEEVLSRAHEIGAESR